MGAWAMMGYHMPHLSQITLVVSSLITLVVSHSFHQTRPSGSNLPSKIAGTVCRQIGRSKGPYTANTTH